jgi:hypothetical protein
MEAVSDNSDLRAMADARTSSFPFGWLRTARALWQWGRRGVPFHSGRDAVLRAVTDREARFLGVLDRLVYGNPRSPYLALLCNAGCEFSDVRREVAQHGLEGALRRLSHAGVYVTHDEMKGRGAARAGGVPLPAGGLRRRIRRAPTERRHERQHGPLDSRAYLP